MKPHPPLDVPPQPGPSVQETDFEPDVNTTNSQSDLTILPHEPIQDEDHNANTTNGYGTLPGPDHASSQSPPTTRTRALAPDLLRGLLMILMALDHNAMALHSWPHGTAVSGEYDSVVVHEWNRPFAIVVRTLTHLCAPGFTFLLGMGVAYFSRSRSNLGWSTGRMARHFALRAVVLTGVTEAMGLALTIGEVWFFNIVLFALAVDYLLAGMLWVVLAGMEKKVAFGLLKVLPGRREDDATEPLLRDREGEEEIAPDRAIIRAADVSWHLHNALLLVLAVVAIWGNVWLSPTGGHCGAAPVQKLPETLWIRIWVYPVMNPHVMSGFPPLAWVSFAILGLLYGRIVLARSWSTRAINLANTTVGLVFFLIFASTRVFHYGNLSEGCLQMPEHLSHPDQNPYLASVASFFYLVKYPPDVAFWSFTMAANFLLLACFGAIPPRVATKVFHVLLVFGTSALFFYVAHIVLLFMLGAGWLAWLGHPLDSPDPWTNEPGRGVDQLWAFLASWALVLAILYPICRWYGEFKRTKGPDSIWRFF